MPNRVRVLIVEDQSDRSHPIESACAEAIADGNLLVEVARHRIAALDLLRKQHFDAAVCDLAIPNDAVSMAPDLEHGLAVVRNIREQHCGLPLIVLSDYGDDPAVLRGLLRGANRADPYGLGGDFPMLLCHPREDLPECLRELKESLNRSARVAALPVRGSDAAKLEPQEVRVIQIFALRWGGSAAEVAGMGGGLSRAKTLRLRVLDSSGNPTAIVAAKLGDRDRVLQECDAYKQLSMLLPAKLGVPLSDTVDAGAGGYGGAFYRLADEHTRDLFECLEERLGSAEAAATSLAKAFTVVYENASTKDLSLLELRRDIVGSSDARNAGALENAICELDQRGLQTVWCLQHGDLHGKNVLVSTTAQPLLIDYGHVRKTAGCLDPLTLELSPIFHPDGVTWRGSWPSEVQAAEWWDLDAYVVGCPFEDYIRTCRAWLLRVASEDEINAVVIAYALRQLGFSDCPKPLAMALIEQACARLTSRTG